ncbi:Undecaprenyl diphosphate synthase [hydrothermal vent metagenome]|uniref:Undecaprenyl diphosphate synthase n=1 Tax=hydrothermal vent metagenome TaxID=652676 RepID=A0A3B1BYI6_9ZZZZ
MGSGAGKKTKSRDQITQIPQHVAIIMDGNGRWAKKRNLPRHAGHRAGVESVRVAVEECARHGVQVLTLFAFSSENWNRPKKEVGLLLDLFMTALHRDVKRLKKNNICLRVIGDRSVFSEKLQLGIQTAETETAGNTGLILQIAANYGGRWDITQAARKLAQKVRDGDLDPDAISESSLTAELSFADLPEPDLFVRTGGEQRISNFILWQTAYSELYFCDQLWPDFDAAAFEQALVAFGQRERRFGKTSEQVEVQKPMAAEPI